MQGIEDGHRVNDAMLIKALANELDVAQSDIKIKSFEVSGGSNKGDNFACVMKAVDFVAVVKGKEHKHRYLVKSVPMNEFRAKWLNETGMFTSEVVVYDSLLPRFRRLEKCCCSKLVTPRHFYASADEGVIIMGDMKLDGYYMGDKAAGLTMPQIRLVLQQLARLHATSYHFLTTFPGGVEAFKKEFELFTSETWFRKGSEQLEEQTEQMFAGVFHSFTTIIQEFCSDTPGLADKLKEFNAVRKKRVDNVHRPADDLKGFNCMLHNDSWCNNFLFKNNADGVVNEAVLLDLQLMKRGRPGVDLAYFFGSSTTPEFRKKHLEELLKMYYKELSRVLLMHGYNAEDVYPFATFRAEFDECYVFGFVLGTMHAQMALNPPDTFDPDVEIKSDEDQLKMMEEYKKKQITLAQQNPVLRNRLVAIAREAESLGILCAA